jgi:hypothetical protein
MRFPARRSKFFHRRSAPKGQERLIDISAAYQRRTSLVPSSFAHIGVRIGVNGVKENAQARKFLTWAGGDGRESNLPPCVRLRSSLSATVGIFCIFTAECAVSVRQRSPALVSKQVSTPHIAPLLIPQACCRWKGMANHLFGVISVHQTGFRLARSVPNS